MQCGEQGRRDIWVYPIRISIKVGAVSWSYLDEGAPSRAWTGLYSFYFWGVLRGDLWAGGFIYGFQRSFCVYILYKSFKIAVDERF